jgi:hypothetical protein
MTEADWLVAQDPEAMLLFLRGNRTSLEILESPQGRSFDRKARLFSVACCRRLWPMLVNERLREVAKDLSFDLTNKPGKDSYPISGAVWAVCYQKQPAATRKEVVDFLQWATHEGQKLTSMVYASLPEELVKRVDDKLNSIE